MARNNLKHLTLGSISALALAAAGNAAAVDFKAGDTDVSLGGYVRGDFIYNVNEDLGDTAFFRNITVPRDDDIEKARLHARQSRLVVTTTTPMDMGGDLFTRFEGDFFGGGGTETVSNSNSFRMRHAYGEYNGILFGQTWSNFMPMVFGPTVDFGGPAGYIFNRQAQIRYTAGAGAGSFSVALENPESTIVAENQVDSDGDGTPDSPGAISSANDPLPDLTARFAGGSGGLHFEISGALVQLEQNTGSDSESTTGFGINFAGSYSTGGTSFGGNVGWFDGTNRYLWQNGTGFNGGYINDDGEIETVSELGVMAYIDQALSPKTNVALILGYVDTDSDDESADRGIADESLMTVHANIRHSPVDRVTYGFELQYGDREVLSGDSEDAARLQVSGTYSF